MATDKTINFNVRLTPEDRKALDALARREGFDNVSAWLRRIIRTSGAMEGSTQTRQPARA